MTRRAEAVGRQVLLFGEDDTDRRAVRAFVVGLRPELGREIKLVRTPPTLVKGMRPENARSRHVRVLAAVRAAHARRKVRATLLHEDADDIEPAHLALIRQKEEPLRGAPGAVVAVVPAWELETWLLLFPEAVTRYRPSWRTPDDYAGRNVGLVRHSKERLGDLVRTRAKGRSTSRAPGYAETDSPGIAQAAADAGMLRHPRSRSESWRVFVARIDAI